MIQYYVVSARLFARSCYQINLSMSRLAPAASARKVAMLKRRAAGKERYVVRFANEDKYAVIERKQIIGDNEVIAGASVKVVYDKLHNKEADALVLFVGTAEDAAIVEDKLAEVGVNQESMVLAEVENILREERANVDATAQKRRKRRVVLRRPHLSDRTFMGMFSDNAQMDSHRVDEYDTRDGWEEDVHLSGGSAPPSPETVSGLGIGGTAGVIGTALQAANSNQEELTENYHWSPPMYFPVATGQAEAVPHVTEQGTGGNAVDERPEAHHINAAAKVRIRKCNYYE